MYTIETPLTHVTLLDVMSLSDVYIYEFSRVKTSTQHAHVAKTIVSPRLFGQYYKL